MHKEEPDQNRTLVSMTMHTINGLKYYDHSSGYIFDCIAYELRHKLPLRTRRNMLYITFVSVAILSTYNILFKLLLEVHVHVQVSPLRFIWQFSFAPKFLCLFELMLSVPVNSYGHVGTLPSFYGTYTQN